MSSLPDRADVVVIGAGIVGNSVIYHLAELGWRNIVQLDKGPLPDPGGSTGHASNFIFPVDHSKELTALTLDSMRQYEKFGTLTTCGGIEVAREQPRVAEFGRRMASSTSWGIESELITPDRVAELVPFIEKSLLLQGFYTPSVGVVDSLRTGALMREHAVSLGALTISANTEVLGIDVARGRVTRVRTDQGDIETETVVIACGVWSPRVARMAGASIPLTPAVHQMIDVGPIPLLAETGTEIAFPIVRDMDTFMYERQSGADLEVGSYAHRPILHEPDEIPSIAAAQLSPTQLPFTADDFDKQMADALQLFPILDTEGAGVRHAINGLLSLTPDGAPLLGETPEVGGLWSAAAVWIKEGPGVGRMLAQWMTEGQSEIDLHAADIARFYPHQRSRWHVRARANEGFPKTYGIVHPREQWASNRPLRLSPFYAREVELGAEFFEVGGWERPQWYESNRPLVEEYGVADRPHEWDARWWSPIINAEHLAMRERVAMIDLTAFAQFEVSGPGALDYLQNLAVAQLDRPVGRLIYTPILGVNGGFRSDLTIVRLAEDRFRVVTGGADGARDLKWFADHLPADGSAALTDVSSAVCTVGVWGPRARDLLAAATEGGHDAVSNETFRFGTARWLEIGGVPVLALRLSYVGELGWELHAPFEQGARLWDTLWAAGQPFGVVPAGIGVYGTTGRLEKGYRLMGAELESEYDPVEADLALPKVKSQDFVGKAAYLAAREQERAAVLCTLTIEAQTHRFPSGGEPIVTPAGERITDAKGRPSYVTSAGAGPSVGKYLLLAYLPESHAVEGTELAVEYMNERYPVRVARVGRTPLFDPDDERMKV